MRDLINTGNVDPATVDFPYGKIRDTNVTDGTTINNRLLGDFFHSLQKFMHEVGEEPNNEVDSQIAEGFNHNWQLLDGLARYVYYCLDSEWIDRQGDNINGDISCTRLIKQSEDTTYLQEVVEVPPRYENNFGAISGTIRGVAVDNDHVFIANSTTPTVFTKYDHSANIIDSGINITDPAVLKSDGDDILLAIASGVSKIVISIPKDDLSIVDFVGSPGSGVGEYSDPVDVKYINDQIIVIDEGRGMVIIYNNLGAYVSEFAFPLGSSLINCCGDEESLYIIAADSLIYELSFTGTLLNTIDNGIAGGATGVINLIGDKLHVIVDSDYYVMNLDGSEMLQINAFDGAVLQYSSMDYGSGRIYAVNVAEIDLAFSERIAGFNSFVEPI